MASRPPPPPRGGGMSLYANLLDSSADNNSSGDGGAAATISRLPVVFKQADGGNGDSAKDEGGGPKKDVNAALRFQPMIRRPVAPQKKTAKPITFPKAIIPPSTVATAASAAQASQQASAADGKWAKGQPTGQQQPPAKNTLANWTAARADEVHYVPGEPKRKRKKKRKDEQVETDWNELYDPARPTNVEEYLRSDERIREIREWKEVLYRHRRKNVEEKNDEERSYYSEDEEEDARPKNNAFAPPSSYNFAPPPPSPPRATIVPDDATGEDAYSRRLALSRGVQSQPPPPREPSPPSALSPAPPAIEEVATAISRAPVRYTQPEPEPMDEDNNSDHYSPRQTLGEGTEGPEETASAPKSNRPGQAGFAQRLMTKYGWSAGTGLGASESGIVNPLQVRLEKRRKRPDSEGGGWAESGGRAKIVGGQVSKAVREREEKESFGKMSEVIVLAGMLDNMSDAELAGEIAEGGLQQEIGEECGEKYGRVERLHIDTSGKKVYIKFTDQVSALRAVNSLQGRIFNGNAIVAKFFDSDRFEKRDFA